MSVELVVKNTAISFNGAKEGVFTLLSKSDWFCITWPHDWLKKTRVTFLSNQNRS